MRNNDRRKKLTFESIFCQFDLISATVYLFRLCADWSNKFSTHRNRTCSKPCDVFSASSQRAASTCYTWQHLIARQNRSIERIVWPILSCSQLLYFIQMGMASYPLAFTPMGYCRRRISWRSPTSRSQIYQRFLKAWSSSENSSLGFTCSQKISFTNVCLPGSFGSIFPESSSTMPKEEADMAADVQLGLCTVKANERRRHSPSFRRGPKE